MFAIRKNARCYTPPPQPVCRRVPWRKSINLFDHFFGGHKQSVRQYRDRCGRAVMPLRTGSATPRKLCAKHHSFRDQAVPFVNRRRERKTFRRATPRTRKPQERYDAIPTAAEVIQGTEVANELTPEELGKVSAGTFNGFLSFGDIKGESTDKDHKDWIEVSSFQHKR
jgi:hypothetical protein